MSDRTPSAVPTWPAVAAEQMRMVALLQKRDFLIVGGITLILVALSLWGLTVTVVEQGDRQSTVAIFRGLVFPFGLIGALWPLGVWRHDSPEQRGYFWSLPVPRGPHTLVRVAIGWLLLMGVCIAITVIAGAIGLLYDAKLSQASLSLDAWYLPLAVATLAYLLISVLAVLVDSPVRWVIWIAIGLFGVRIIAGVTRTVAIRDTIDAVTRSLVLAFSGPVPEHVAAVVGPWSLHYLIWIGLGSLALVAAAFRHRDAR